MTRIPDDDANNTVDGLKLSQMLSELRLPTMRAFWKRFAERADTEGWPAARFLAVLAEHELAERDRRRIQRHLSEARLLPGKSLANFDFNVVPTISKARVRALAAGDAWLSQGISCLIFGPPGVGKSHLASAIGLALVENGTRVLFTRTTDLVQRLQVARRELTLENQLARLGRYHLVILDDFTTVRKDQAETSVLFELISVRYERRSLLITANQPFENWGKIFPDEITAVAAVDRLVHRAPILEMNVESYRRREALVAAKQRKPGRPAQRATEKKRPSTEATQPPETCGPRSTKPAGRNRSRTEVWLRQLKICKKILAFGTIPCNYHCRRDVKYLRFTVADISQLLTRYSLLTDCPAAASSQRFKVLLPASGAQSERPGSIWSSVTPMAGSWRRVSWSLRSS